MPVSVMWNFKVFSSPTKCYSFSAIFMTMFLALRGMTDVPVQSFKTGGALWFNDLTISDPFFLLPLLTTSSLLVNLWIGGEGQSLDTMPPPLRKVIFALPIISFPFMCYFPSALNVYWLTSNLFTITQARIISIPKVRDSVGIPELMVRPKDENSMDFMKRVEELAKERNKKEW